MRALVSGDEAIGVCIAVIGEDGSDAVGRRLGLLARIKTCGGDIGAAVQGILRFLLKRGMDLFYTFHVEAARRLPHLPDGHPCSRVHGHSFRVEVHVTGPLHPHLGWVMDFAALEAAVQEIRDKLDHRYLNDLPGLANPTSEHLAIWIWAHLKPELPGLSKVVVQETDHSGCVYTGD